MGVGGQRHAPAALPRRKRPITDCTGWWALPRAGLDGCIKYRPPPGFDSQTIQPVAGCYTDYTLPGLAFGGTQDLSYSPPQCSGPAICGVNSADS